MEWFETSLGRVPLWGNYESDRPLVLVIRGAMPALEYFAELDPVGADLALLHLPGFHSGRLRETSIEAFIAAFDEVIRARFSGRQITAVGVSTGALVALGLHSPEVRQVLAVEPFFSTGKLWPLVEFMRGQLKAHDQRTFHEWVWAIFGYSLDAVEDRNYEWVLERRDRPVLGLVGDVPMNPRRPVYGLPSLTDDADRARLSCKVVQSAHNMPIALVRAALADLHKHDVDATIGAVSGAVAATAATAAGG